MPTTTEVVRMIRKSGIVFDWWRSRLRMPFGIGSEAASFLVLGGVTEAVFADCSRDTAE